MIEELNNDIVELYSDTDNLIDKFEVESLPQIEAKLNPELDKLKTDLTDTIMSDPTEAAKILISYIKD